jgi:hypothetical protein
MPDSSPGPDDRLGSFQKNYDQICTSYHSIDDFRAKLLGLIPAVSGAAVIILNKEAESYVVPVSILGFIITFGLLCYEIYGVEKCANLINIGSFTEAELGIPGQFRSRPDAVKGIINETFAASIVYSAVLSMWVYLAFIKTFTLAIDQKYNYVSIILTCLISFFVFAFSFRWMCCRECELQNKYPIFEVIKRDDKGIITMPGPNGQDLKEKPSDVPPSETKTTPCRICSFLNTVWFRKVDTAP